MEKVVKYYGKGEWKDVSGGTVATIEHNKAKSNLNAESALHEAKLLSLNIDKAVSVLGWKPKLSIDEAVKLTVDYYKLCRQEDVYELCSKQIGMYEEKM